MSNQKVRISKIINDQKFTVVETKNTFPAFRGKENLYPALEVDEFLDEIGESVQKLETYTKKIYDENEELRQENKTLAQKQQETKVMMEEKVKTVAELELEKHTEAVANRVDQKVSQEQEPVTKVQQQMVAFLEQAEVQSVEILKEAMAEKEKVLLEAEKQARQIVAEAMNQATEQKMMAQETVNQTREASERLQQEAQHVQREMMRKAAQLDEFGKQFNKFADDVKNVARG